MSTVWAQLAGEGYMGYALAGNVWSLPPLLLLSSDSHAIISSDSYPPVPFPPDFAFGNGAVQINPADWTILSDENGTTATLAPQSIPLIAGIGSSTYTQWWLADANVSVWYAAGSLTPPVGYGGSAETVTVSGITLTLAQCSTSPPAGPIWQDFFAEDSPTAAGSHSPDIGSGYTTVAGTPIVNAGVYYGSTGQNWVVMDLGVTDYSITLAGRAVGSANFVIVVVRFVDDNNYYRILMGNTFVQLDQVLGGSSSTTSSATLGLGTSDPFLLDISVIGSGCTATVNGSASVSYGTMSIGLTSDTMGLSIFTGFGPVGPTMADLNVYSLP